MLCSYIHEKSKVSSFIIPFSAKLVKRCIFPLSSRPRTCYNTSGAHVCSLLYVFSGKGAFL